MANNITKLEDMSGRWNLSQKINETYFDNLAFNLERQILRGNAVTDYGLLGDEEYIKLIADLVDGVPQTQKYIDLVNGKNYTNSNGKLTVFEGIKEMLNLFVYAEIIKRGQFNSTQMGMFEAETENASATTKKLIMREANLRYNMAVDIHNIGAYYYISDNSPSVFVDWYFTRKSKYFTNGLISE